MACEIPASYPSYIKRLRARLGLTQAQLADSLGVALATVNRWENGQARPSPLAWRRLLQQAQHGTASAADAPGSPAAATDRPTTSRPEPVVDFAADAAVVTAVAEAHRLTYGHLFNPSFATETSLVDPLPHQYVAVYEVMLKQPQLRLLLADDAGAGKTIMTGLYIREMLSRRLLRRALIVPPAGLVGNWEREMRLLFSLSFQVATGRDARAANPFCGPQSDLVIVSVDTLATEQMFARLQEPNVAPYDLVVFDEAHKLSADRQPDLTLRRTHRYELAEALAGIRSENPRWRLDWAPRHLLLLTATPHMGKDAPYLCLWRLLEPEALPTPEAFAAFPAEARRRHFIRRTKEELVHYDESPLYPTRKSDTLSFPLTQGPVSEGALYDQTSSYIRKYYDCARLLNRSAVRLAMSVFQRRLASSTYALLQSLRRRLDKLDRWIEDTRAGRVTTDELRTGQRRPQVFDPFDEATADEEEAEDGREANEVAEDWALEAVAASHLEELQQERDQVRALLELARRVYETQEESKFERLRELMQDPGSREEKLIIFTEHRDTLGFLVRRLEGLGCTGRVAQIHGGMDYREREEQVAFFRRPVAEGGAMCLVATDAAGEGINLQFCWRMVNYDIPWNPARLEQRMGRIHRYGQRHDPVLIVNLVSSHTREGRVLATLLGKLELIRQQIGSDKVFDVIGRLFEEVSLREYMERATTEEGADEACRDVQARCAADKVLAVAERERQALGAGDTVRPRLDGLEASRRHETLRHLIPGYVLGFIKDAAPLLNLVLEGDENGLFRLKALQPGAMDFLMPALEAYPPWQREHLAVKRPQDPESAVFLRPGEPVFECLRGTLCARYGEEALRGSVFVDPTASRPYLFHLVEVPVVRKGAPSCPALAREQMLESRLVGLRQTADGVIEPLPVEHLLLLKGGHHLPPGAVHLAADAAQLRGLACAYTSERVAAALAEEQRRALRESLEERAGFVGKGYDYQAADFAAARSRLTEKAKAGDPKAQAGLEEVKAQQAALAAQKAEALAALRQEPELIAEGQVKLLALALVVPSTDPEDARRHDEAVTAVAMAVARAYEEAEGAQVRDVSTPDLARGAGLTEHPGFDLLSLRPGGEERPIEVKGRAQSGDIELSRNEWSRACNLGERYWLYVVFGCGGPQPRLLRIKDPFERLLARAKGGVIIPEQQIFLAAEEGP